MIDVQTIIDQQLLKEQEEKGKRVRSGKFSPSLLGRCYRLQVWNRQGEPITNPPDIRSLRKFKKGNLYHKFIEDLLPAHITEKEVNTDDIKGFADIVLDDMVVDIKSVHTNDTNRMFKKDYDVYEQKKSNWIQVATYAWLLEKPRCGLFFIDENCVITQFTALTKKFIPEIEEELKILKIYWENKNLPPAIPRAYSGKDCSYCSFYTHCKEVEDGHK